MRLKLLYVLFAVLLITATVASASAAKIGTIKLPSLSSGTSGLFGYINEPLTIVFNIFVINWNHNIANQTFNIKI